MRSMVTGYNVSNLITLLITPSNGTDVKNVGISLIHCQSTCNKSNEVTDVVNDMALCVRVIMETWQTGNDPD